jgi:hypothetical protein
MDGSRTVHCGDAIAWLSSRATLDGASVITSMPDISETPALSLPEWKRWFVDCAVSILSRCPPDGVAIFYQTDVKRDGVWIDKGYLCSKAAEQTGAETLWHKIVCRRPPATLTYGGHAYSHMLCFSRGIRHDMARSTPDVLSRAGENLWTRGMGLDACAAAVRYVLGATPTRTVIDPFCGRGTVLAVANALGVDAVGIELNRRRARQARTMRVEIAADGEVHLVRPIPADD